MRTRSRVAKIGAVTAPTVSGRRPAVAARKSTLYLTLVDDMPITIVGFSDAAPSPRIEIVLPSLVGAVVTVTVQRFWDGKIATVRGASRAAAIGGFAVTDYEAPLGVPVTYMATGYDTSGAIVSQSPTSPPVILAATDPNLAWLSDPLAPTLAKQVFLRVGSENLSYDIGGAVLPIMGSRDPIGVGSTRQSASGVVFRMEAPTGADAVQLRDLLGQASPVLVRTHPRLRMPRLAYVHAPSVDEGVEDYWSTDPSSVWMLSGRLVRPQSAAVVVPVFTWADLLQFDTWADVLAAKATWLDVLRDPTP